MRWKFITSFWQMWLLFVSDASRSLQRAMFALAVQLFFFPFVLRSRVFRRKYPNVSQMAFFCIRVLCCRQKVCSFFTCCKTHLASNNNLIRVFDCSKLRRIPLIDEIFFSLEKSTTRQMITVQRMLIYNFNDCAFRFVFNCQVFTRKTHEHTLLNNNRYEIFILKSHSYQEIFKAKFPTLASWILNIQFRMATA